MIWGFKMLLECENKPDQILSPWAEEIDTKHDGSYIKFCQILQCFRSFYIAGKQENY